MTSSPASSDVGPLPRAGKRVAILQSCYIPWKGYFDLINRVDEFIVYDDRQYTKNDWRNRNRIKTPHGLLWITIPIARRGLGQRIDEATPSDPRWAEKHWKTLVQFYARAPHFAEYRDGLEELYREVAGERLSTINRRFLETICELLGIRTPFVDSVGYDVEGRKSDRVVALCRAAGATAYLSGPSARDYVDEDAFREAGIELEYMDYGAYPEYPQLFPPFVHEVTVLDLLFNTGPDAPRYMKSFG